MADRPRFSVHFDEEAFTEDFEHATPAGRDVARREPTRLEGEGLAASELQACESEARDGTRLGDCVKTYLPQPDGGWGMVFTGDIDANGVPILVHVAFGVRHPGTTLAAERLPSRSPPATTRALLEAGSRSGSKHPATPTAMRRFRR